MSELWGDKLSDEDLRVIEQDRLFNKLFCVVGLLLHPVILLFLYLVGGTIFTYWHVYLR